MQMARRILFIIDNLEIGGAQNHFVTVSKGLRERGWCPEVFPIFTGGRLETALREVNIPVHLSRFSLNGSRYVPQWLGRLLFLPVRFISLTIFLASQKFDLIHFCLPGSYIFGGLASIITWTTPRIMSRRSLNNYKKNKPLLSFLEKSLFPSLTLAIANSDAVLADLLKEGVPGEKLRLIYNGVDVSKYRLKVGPRGGMLSDSQPVNIDRFVCIVVANLFPYKGHLTLLEALWQVRDKLPRGWRCLCAGEDRGFRDELVKETRRLNLQEEVLWLGGRKDIPNLLSVADVSIVCSYEEGFSNAVLEAMAAGLPLVATDVGGNREAIADGTTGILVPTHNSSALADGILKLSSDKQLRVRMGLAGYTRAKERFNLSRSIDRYEETYSRVIYS